MHQEDLSILTTFMDAFAPDYRRHCEEVGVNNTIDREVAFTASFNPKKVLEFGVADGRFAVAFLQDNPHVTYTGVDISKKMLSQITDSRIFVVCDDIENFSDRAAAASERFDLCIGPFTVLHMIKQEYQLSIIKAIFSVTNMILLHVYNEKLDDIMHENGSLEHVFFNGLRITTYPIDKAVRALTVDTLVLSERLTIIVLLKPE